ncbi:putative PAB-dependent poly(A)-specific ribonuclease subunit 3 [Cryptosporidium serpentis]
MKEKSIDTRRNENDSKKYQQSLGTSSMSSFHADAPTFKPRLGFLTANLTNNVGQTTIAQSLSSNTDIPSNLTASAQPFVPSSIRQNTSGIVDPSNNNGSLMDHSFMMSGNNFIAASYPQQGLLYPNISGCETIGTGYEGTHNVEYIDGEYESVISSNNVGSGLSGSGTACNNTNSNIANNNGVPSLAYHGLSSNSTYSNSHHSNNAIIEVGNFYGEPTLSNNNQPTASPNDNPSPLDLSEYCRRVRGWNLPFLRTIPQMNAITQIRHELQLQNISLLLTQNDIECSNHNSMTHTVPPVVQRIYYGLCLLDDPNVTPTTRFCGYQTYAYKAINAEDYTAYCLRRIDGYSISDYENSKSILERWQKLTQHPCIVSYRQCFVSLDFSPGTFISVYDYIPNASTMESVHFKEPIGEPLLWNYIIQIVLALVHIHSAQLAARVIDPTKLLISYRGRLRLNCVGILDFTRIDHTKIVTDYQKQDLVALGYIILALCCGSLTIINDLNHAVEQIFLKSSSYSNDLKKLVLILLSKPALHKNNLDVFILANMLAARMIPQIEHSLKLTDALENEFKKEIDNGRLFRLLTKINTIADRNQLNSVHKWNETGDRYTCKLFREYLFQQTDSQGRPIIDMGHIFDALAKVDIGTSETVTLMSSDGSSILLVSFADIKNSIDKSFCEIVAAATTSSNFQ